MKRKDTEEKERAVEIKLWSVVFFLSPGFSCITITLILSTLFYISLSCGFKGLFRTKRSSSTVVGITMFL